ncbi:hypothetical protein MHLP_02780 [Candidatus Mycoplasma haematolamae str. Purdue]|uniref:Uncharacterized protein n=1 Tax=Mycoplasma haematolamae (strain Purdue) TaxID=1212765 RepID=I7CFY1_MYCHA|nr:hypothetical protein [Candidatus Mycoplasma haematolamae]AFO52136.1 hypothetical protein MHLP_02780 [Candidatus Mycoplasma haematolamae str. Purdue]
MGGLAKIAALLTAGGGISAVATPIAISSQNYNEKFKFTDINGKKETVTLECAPKEGKYAYPKIDLQKKTIRCDYSESPDAYVTHLRSLFGTGVNTLNCTNNKDSQTDKSCHVKSFKVKEDGSLTFEY